MRNWVLAAVGAALIMVGSLIAWAVQTSGGSVEVRDVRFPAPGGVQMSGLLYVPKGVSASAPGPAILVSHGLINTREMQSPFAIELSRRGYVVLAMDMSGHGYSGGVLGQNTHGGPAAFAYLTSLPFVDKTAIGLEGHSLGGAPILGAAKANPDGYRAIVLEGSTITIGGRGDPGAPPFNPRNVAVVFGQYEEFPTMWGAERGLDVPAAPRLRDFFGTPDPVVPGRLYGSIEDGTARLLVTPPINHPQEHFTRAGVGAALDWFARTVPTASEPLPAGDQVWLFKELGTLAGFIGGVILILGVFRGLISTPLFAGLQQEGRVDLARRGPRWLLAAALTAIVPAVTYFPAMENGAKIFLAPFAWVGAQEWALKTFSQQITNQLVVWALLNGVIGLILSYVLRSGRPRFDNRWLLAAGAALGSVGAGYLALVLVDAVFKVDFRFWVLGLKPLDGRHFILFLTYLPAFTVFFLLTVRSYAAGLPIKGEGTARALITAALAMSLGFVLMLGIQYGSMLSRGELAHNNALLTIVAYQFVPLLAVIGVIAAYTWRLTNSYAPGALICALFITWYIVAGTAIYPPRAPGQLSGRPTPPAASQPAAPAPPVKTP